MIQTGGNALMDRLMHQLRNQLIPEPGQAAGPLRTPFLYPDNTPFTIHAQMDEQKVIVSDHGEASDYAFLNGVSSSDVEDQLAISVHRHGLIAIDDELVIDTDVDSPANAVLAVVSAIQEIGNLVYHQAR